MRRVRALALFTVGYMLLALLPPPLATLPALAAFMLASFVLLGAERGAEAAAVPATRRR